ncbi:hypothetical protein NC652_034265 [Populus alba x Populus x berolinensis]|nr:hypothetical protein NC652_034265 [Populus alba x Populus x berolinensis]
MEFKSNVSIAQSQFLLILQNLILPINVLTPLKKLSRTTKWQGVLFPCRFAQLPLHGFASVAVDGLPNRHLRLLYNALVNSSLQDKKKNRKLK